MHLWLPLGVACLLRTCVGQALPATATTTSTTDPSTRLPTALTVATDGSSAFTAINAAIYAAQISGIPTVAVQPGTYLEALTISGTRTVTIAGPTASNYAGNQVVIAAAAPTSGVVTFGTQNSQGVTFQNVNITNTASPAGSKAPAVNVVGMNMAFYDCALVSTGTGVYTASFGISLIADSYIEGTDKLFYNYVTAYVYGSLIVPTAPSANIFYGLGLQTGGMWYNASLVVDSSAVHQKPGLTNTYVYLASPNGNSTVAVYRNTDLGSLIAPSGVRATACNYQTVYGEFANTGAGALSSSNQASRAAACELALTAGQMSTLSVDYIFGHAFPAYSSADTTWIDSRVLQAISDSDASQIASALTSTTSASSASSSATSTSLVAASSTTLSSSTLSSMTGQSSVSDSASSTMSTGTATITGSSATLSSQSSITTSLATAVTVATASAQFTDINAAVRYAQSATIASVVVSAGTYPALTVAGTGSVTISGPAASTVADNVVVISASGATAALTFSTSNAKGVTFRNLNFTNSATSGLGPAVSMAGSKMAFYGCSLLSAAQGAFTSSYATTLIANSYIEGSDKLFYNYPSVYVFNSTIVPTASGSSIFYAKGATIGGTNYNATMVVDSSVVAAKAGSSTANVYLASPNGLNNYTVAIYRNSMLSSLVAAGGVYSTACSVVAVYGEFLTTGAGSFAQNAARRGASSCDYSLDSDQVSAYAIDRVFANAFPSVSTSDTTWVDSQVLSAIQASDDAQVSSALASTSSSVPSTTSSGATSSITSATCTTPTPSASLVVSQNASDCQYANITAAISALPNDGKPYTIFIEPGTYTEQLSITRNGKVTLIGNTTFANDYTKNQVRIQFSNGQLTSAGKDESTPVLYAKKSNDQSGLAVYNIDFVNTYPQTTNTAALAADFYGANIAAYGCSFVGFQDTLLANKGTQVFSNCYIEGSIDFIWGFSTAYFHQCYIATNTPGACISAQSRAAGTVSGYVFDTCYVTYTSSYGSSFGLSYLGRPYNSYSTAVYLNSFIDKHINSAGWSVWSKSSPQTDNVTFGEFNNTGPGSWQSDTSRATFATNLTASQASAYTLGNWIGDTSWIDLATYGLSPSYNLTGVPSSTTSVPTTSGPATSASINAHPESGNVPPQYAVLVSPDASVTGSYANVSAALASLPNVSTNQTVFIYPGSYTEQIPAINRPGAVRIIGYTDGSAGRSFKDNKVSITFARGLSVSPLPTGHSDAETAVVSTASKRISFYNIDITNADNLDGLQASYVTLAASIYGNDVAFYGCSFNGWQDTLLTGATAGYQYYESCYIGGAIDFIWGYSKAYFKGCTIGGKRASSCITAQSRASQSAIGGYIFDQCLFTTAPDATVDLTNKMYLGRPYSAYALVVVKNSYIDDIINPSGWKIWSTTDPRTDHIAFAEYNNSGPSNWENNVAARQAFGFSSLLTSDIYPLTSVMDSTDWIDMTFWDSITTPQPTVDNSTAANVTASGSSTFNGTTPPSGAMIVSQQPISGQTVYSTIQAALDAAPVSSKTNATIFIYPGIYEEQLIVSKAGTTIFMGYSEATSDYSQNQVTIQQSVGVDTQGEGSDVDAATVYATGNYFYAYNINFRNNNGTQQNIASLGFAVKSSKYAFMHACQIYGNQDTLYISGSMFAFKTYIEGNVDFIFGAGSGYFLNSTIAPNEDGDSITAQKRTTNTTQAGFVFDQCSVVPAGDSASSGWKNVSLGRPWNNNARVVYAACYLDAMVGSAGWDVWSKSSPQTDGVVFAEYHNFGPGSSTCKRAGFSTQLSDAGFAQYQVQNFFQSTSWIDWSVVDVQPLVAGEGTTPVGCATTSTASSLTTTPTISSSSVLLTVYVTKLYTDKEVTTMTTSIPATTQTTTVVITENDGTTVTPDPILKTSLVKATAYVSTTLTKPQSTITTKTTSTSLIVSTASAKATTLKSTSTVLQAITTVGKGTTSTVVEEYLSTVTSTGKPSTVLSTEVALVTSSIQGKSTTIKTTTTIQSIVTSTAKAVTAHATTMVVLTSTSTPKPVTVTIQQGTLATVYQSITPKASSVTSTISLPGKDVMKTTSVKPSTTSTTVTSMKSTTKKTTVTCNPTTAPARYRRGMHARAAGTTTITLSSTITSFTKTSFLSQLGSTAFATITSTSSTYPTVTLKASTSTVLSTSFATSTVTITQAEDATTVTDVITKLSSSIVTVPGSTFTSLVLVTSYSTISQPGPSATVESATTLYTTTTAPGSTLTSVVLRTSTITVSSAGSTATEVVTDDVKSTLVVSAMTTTSYTVKTSTALSVVPTPTITSIVDAQGTTTLKTTLVAATSTIFKTVTIPGSTSITTITPAPSTKTVTVKQTSTFYSTVIKSKAGASSCPA